MEKIGPQNDFVVFSGAYAVFHRCGEASGRIHAETMDRRSQSCQSFDFIDDLGSDASCSPLTVRPFNPVRYMGLLGADVTLPREKSTFKGS